MERELGHILSFPLPAEKFSPRNKEVFKGCDIVKAMAEPSSLSLSLSLSLSRDGSVISRIKEGYLLWVRISVHIPKNSRYTLGQRVENKFLDLLELIYIAYFSAKSEKPAKVSECILQLDTLKFLISIAWEGKLISPKQFQEIALKLDEVGKMLGGWRKNLNNPDKKNRTV